MNATYKFVLCFLRRYHKNDGHNTLVAAVLAGLWIGLEPKRRRHLLTILMLSRALDCQQRLIVDRGLSKEIPHFNVLIIIFCAVMQQYTFSYERNCVGPGWDKILEKWGKPEMNDRAMHSAF